MVTKTFLGGDKDDINYDLDDYPKETTCKDKTGKFRKRGRDGRRWTRTNVTTVFATVGTEGPRVPVL